MPLSDKESFKVGFLARCAADGLGPDEILARVKAAEDLLEKRAFLGSLLDRGLDAGGSVLKGLSSAALPVSLLAPPAVGGLAGYGLAKMTDVDDTDVDEIKNRELVDEYGRQAERLNRQKLVRDYAKQVKRSGRPLM